tara:strand:+ start:6043 stop:7236 length:1194 start_codon:yes stop_codon:yes gene_type:complete
MYFYLDTPNKKTSAIKLRYYVKSEGKRFIYSAGISISPENWSKKSRMPKAKAGGAAFELRQITNKLNRYVDELHVCIKNLEIDKINITRARLKAHFDLVFKEEDFKTDNLIEKLNLFIIELQKIGKSKKASIDKYIYLKRKLIKYNSNLKISDINKDFMIDFISFLRSYYQLTDITLNRNIGFLKTFVKWLIDGGYNIDNSYKKIIVSTRDADHVSLSLEQVEALSSLELNNTLDKYRDLFLIGVYSGQRFSDYTVFKKSDLMNGRIEKRAEKTDYKSFIPIAKKLKKLLEKYSWRLPKISNQKFNKNIKEICKIAGFNDEVTRTKFLGNKKIEEIKLFHDCVSSHTARRTFITLSADKNVPDHVIMAICGIRQAATLKTYKKINPDSLEGWVDSVF